jgi:hypothetical protein
MFRGAGNIAAAARKRGIHLRKPGEMHCGHIGGDRRRTPQKHIIET